MLYFTLRLPFWSFQMMNMHILSTQNIKETKAEREKRFIHPIDVCISHALIAYPLYYLVMCSQTKIDQGSEFKTLTHQITLTQINWNQNKNDFKSLQMIVNKHLNSHIFLWIIVCLSLQCSVYRVASRHDIFGRIFFRITFNWQNFKLNFSVTLTQ